MKNQLEPITPSEKKDLAKLEAKIHKGIASFVDVGKALLEIHTRKLYKAEYSSFAAYCETRWNLNRTHGYRLMHASEVVENLEKVSPIGDTLPTHESQTRPLQGRSLEVQQAAWADAAAGGHEPTEEEVRQALKDLPPEKQVEKIRKDEKRATSAKKEEGDKDRRRQAESLVARILKVGEGFPETMDVAEPFFKAGLQALLAADDPETFIPLQILAEQVKAAIGGADAA